MHAPAGTTRETVLRLQTEIAKILVQPDNCARLEAVGLAASGMTPEKPGAFETTRRTKWAKVIKDGAIKVD